MAQPAASTQTLTRRQKTIAKALSDPSNRTNSAVARAAGISRPTLYRALQKAHVVHHAEELSRARRDKVEAVFERALSRTAANVDTVEDPHFGLAAMKVASDVMRDMPDDRDSGTTPQDRLRALRKVVMAFRAGARRPDLLTWAEAMLERLSPTPPGESISPDVRQGHLTIDTAIVE